MQIRSTSSIDRAAWILIASLIVCACASTPEPEPKRVCRPLSFRACETDAGRGVEQCAPDGRSFGDCTQVTLDATFPPFDAGADDASDTDGSDSAEAGNDGDLSDAGDANDDGDAGDGSDASDDAALD